VILVLSVVGQEFISRRNRHGFYAWLVSNVCGVAVFMLTGRLLMVALYCYFIVKCVQGLHNWKRLEEQERDATGSRDGVSRLVAP